MHALNYRVVTRLPWIEGGRVGPNCTWQGGKTVVYVPGQIIALTADEVRAECHAVEAIDAAGRAELARARTQAAAPAATTFTATLDTDTCAWLNHAIEEKLRLYGRMLELVQHLVARDVLPTKADLAAVRRTHGALPLPVQAYVRARAQRPQRPGPKYPRRPTSLDLGVMACFELSLRRAREWSAADPGRSKAITHPVLRHTAKQYVGRVSCRTVQRIVAGFRRRRRCLPVA